MSEREKRKLDADGGGHEDVSGATQKKVRDDGLVTDDEVEEFYTILRRINAAAQYFRSGSKRKNSTVAEESHRGWRESLEEEIVRQMNSVKENREIIDLNLSPSPE